MVTLKKVSCKPILKSEVSHSWEASAVFNCAAIDDEVVPEDFPNKANGFDGTIWQNKRIGVVGGVYLDKKNIGLQNH